MCNRSLAASLIAFAAPALAAPVLMTGDWGKDACTAWNNEPVLTDKLVESGWVEMGKGECGPIAAMMFERLGFDGPMLEAMGNMGPFESFLLLIGNGPAETGSCPAK